MISPMTCMKKRNVLVSNARLDRAMAAKLHVVFQHQRPPSRKVKLKNLQLEELKPTAICARQKFVHESIMKQSGVGRRIHRFL